MIARIAAAALSALALAALAACVRYPEPNAPRAKGPVAVETTPAPRAPTTRAELPSGGIHRVKRGETVHGLAEEYGVPVRTLIDVNRLSPPYALTPGQPLFIPRPREHEVAKGDTVYGISRRYGVDMSQLMRLNGIVPPYTIRAGERLRLPAPVETALASAGPTPLPPPGDPAQSGARAPAEVEIEPLEPASGGSASADAFAGNGARSAAADTSRRPTARNDRGPARHQAAASVSSLGRDSRSPLHASARPSCGRSPARWSSNSGRSRAGSTMTASTFRRPAARRSGRPRTASSPMPATSSAASAICC